MKNCLYVFCGCLLLMASACRSAKKIEKAISKPAPVDTVSHTTVVVEDLKADSMRFISEAYERVKKNHLDFQTFSSKMKVNYEGSDGKSYEFTAFMRMQRDKIIWIRVDALLGFEAFRIMITPDSVKILDKLNKQIILRSVSYLQDIAKIPFGFSTVQDLLIGNPIYLDSNILYYRQEASGTSFGIIGQLFKNYITFNRSDFTLQHAKLDDVDVLRARTFDLTYGDYDWVQKMPFSTYRKISITEKSKLDIELSFKQYNFNEVLSFPFPIPKNFKHK